MKKICTGYIGCLHSPAVRWLIIVFWLAAAVCGALFGLNGFLKSTSLTFSPAPGTPSKDAVDAYSAAFPNANHGEIILVYVYAIDGSPLVPAPASWNEGCYVASGPDNKTFVKGPFLELFDALNDTINAYSYPELVDSFTSFCSIADVFRTVPFVTDIMQKTAGALMSENRSATYMLINVKTPGDPLAVTPENMDAMRTATANISAFATYMEKQLPDVEAQFPNMNVKLTGLPVFGLDVLTGVETQLTSSEAVAFPLALIVLAVMLKSVRLLVIPLMCILSSLLLSFLIMWPVALNYNVIQFCPSVMSSVTLALSIDYSLFLLSRFREEVRSQRLLTREAVVINMMQFAGHTVLVSGCTICLCFLALLFFPIEMLASVGIGSSICIAVTILCNCTLTPAMLLTFYPFFSDFHSFGFACCCCRKDCLRRGDCSQRKGETDAKATTLAVADDPQGDLAANADRGGLTEVLMPAGGEMILASDGLALDAADEEHSIDYDRTSCWYKLGRCTTRLNWLVILLMAGCVVPFAYFVPQLNLLHAFVLVAPRGSNSSVAYQDLVDTFGAGTLFSSSLLVVPQDGVSVMSQEFFTRSADYMASLTAAMPNTTIEGITYFCGLPKPVADNCRVNYTLVNYFINDAMEQYRTNGTFPTEIEDVLAIFGITDKEAYDLANAALDDFFYGVFVNPNATAMDFVVNIPDGIDVFSAAGGDWIEGMRTAVDNLVGPDGQPNTADNLYLCKGDTVTHDAINLVLDYFPKIVAGTLAAVFVLVAIAFRTLFVPLRSVVTIAMTLAWVYGFAIMTYQIGILDWTTIASLQSTQGFYWMAPIMSFSVIVGVGLDYDIFLLTRVLEYRRAGLGETEAVVAGLSQTGHIITAAGVIMAIAFSGLLLSTEAVLNQLAFLLVFAVLVDTFIVRSMLVPAVMSALGKLNWWPQKFKNDVADQRAT